MKNLLRCRNRRNRTGVRQCSWFSAKLVLVGVAVPSFVPQSIAASGQHDETQARCHPIALQARVSQGESYVRRIARDLDFKLEAIPGGWIVRVLPHHHIRPAHDYAELANPPYRSPTPLLISTDFAFRAQDAVAWNPRTFRYFTRSEDVRIAEGAYQALQEKARPAAGKDLLAILPHAREATLTILDAGFTGGTANQTGAAALVATHLAQTAHHVESSKTPTPLGELLDLKFRVVFPAETCSTFAMRH